MSKGGLFLTTLSALVTIYPVPRHFHRPIVKNGCLIELGALTSACQPIDEYFDSNINISVGLDRFGTGDYLTPHQINM